MKKIFLMIMAVAAIGFTSCNKEGAKGGEAADAPEAAITGTQTECENYTFTLPEGFTGENDILGYQAKNEADKADLNVAFNETGPTDSQLNEAMVNWTNMKKNNGETVDEAKVDGNIATLRSVKDGTVNEFFLVVLDGSKGVSGTLSFPEAQAEKYEALLMPFLKSFKLK